MKKERIALGWYIPVALVGIIGLCLTLLACFEIGGAYYIEYAIAFIFSISAIAFGAINTFLELYNDYLEKE